MQIHHGIELFVKKVCFALSWVENNVLKNFHYLLFCMKFPDGRQLFLKNRVLLHCSFKTAFCQVLTNFR